MYSKSEDVANELSKMTNFYNEYKEIEENAENLLIQKNLSE